VVSHEFNPRITLTGAWVYGTGNAITIPLYRYDYFGIFPFIPSVSYKFKF